MESLFELQDEDVLLGQLRHRLEDLNERVTLSEAIKALDSIRVELSLCESEINQLITKEKRLELEIDSIDEKLSAADDKLYGGSITTEREVKGLQDEILHSRERKDILEMEALEILELVQDMSEKISTLKSSCDSQAFEVEGLEKIVFEVEEDINRQLSDSERRRSKVAAELSPEVLDSYESHRKFFSSSSVVRFEGLNCKGCPLSMPAVESDRVKGLEVGTLTECKECGRLVVR